MMEELYRLPEYYDVAFSWDAISQEIDILRTCFSRHATRRVETLLEPGCGTGRFLVQLPGHGYRLTGYDASPAMVIYARERILRAGLQNVATVLEADMRTAKFESRFDSAFNVINTIGYLLSDEEIVAHFSNTARSLQRGGVYVIQLGCAGTDPGASDSQTGAPGTKAAEEWTCERDDIRVRTTWACDSEDRQQKLSYQVCRMDIDDHGHQLTLEDRHTMRLWLYPELVGLIEECGEFRLEAIYDSDGRRIPLSTHITGEMGNLYYVLKV